LKVIMIKKALLFLTLFIEISPISLVYNLKTRRIFFFGGSAAAGALSPLAKKKSIWLLSIIPIVYKRKRHIVTDILDRNLHVIPIDVFEKRVIRGSIFNLRYIYKRSFWFEVTTGAEKERAISCGTINSDITRKGVDDIVVSTGYNIFPNKDTQFTPYIIGGVPVNRSLTSEELFDTFVGTRFYGLGAGGEFAYSFVNSLKTTFAGLLQLRSIHFFPKKWTPVLPCSATLNPGNVTDFLIAAQYRKKKTLVEVGFDSTFFTNQAIWLKTGSLETDKFVRQSFYANFGHLFTKFPFIPKPVLLGAGFYVAELKRFDTKISSFWVNFTVIF